MEISVYAFETKEGESASDWTTQDYEAAKQFAMKHRCCLIERTFTYSDSELLEDYSEEDDPDCDVESAEETCSNCGDELTPEQFDDRQDDDTTLCSTCQRRKACRSAKGMIDAAYAV